MGTESEEVRRETVSTDGRASGVLDAAEPGWEPGRFEGERTVWVKFSPVGLSAWQASSRMQGEQTGERCRGRKGRKDNAIAHRKSGC
jgi:hypothetical protein